MNLVRTVARRQVKHTLSVRVLTLRNSSSLIAALDDEIGHAKEDSAANPTIAELLAESDSVFSLEKETDNLIKLVNGNATVSFDPALFEANSDEELAVPFEFILTGSAKQLSMNCIARRNFDEEDQERFGEIEIEEVAVEKSGADNVYSPKIGELDEELTTSMFEYLISKGVDDSFGMLLAEIAEAKEQDLYLNWLLEFKDFVKETE
eukprot:augustus_masked-scaffold_12-processed-gene-12.86-mRNA-1 protein AED:1.00 eAED:1.00 QI:0/-1/0/0/-1/1/1/0/206